MRLAFQEDPSLAINNAYKLLLASTTIPLEWDPPGGRDTRVPSWSVSIVLYLYLPSLPLNTCLHGLCCKNQTCFITTFQEQDRSRFQPKIAPKTQNWLRAMRVLYEQCKDTHIFKHSNSYCTRVNYTGFHL